MTAGASTPSRSRDIEHEEYRMNGPLFGCAPGTRLWQQSERHHRRQNVTDELPAVDVAGRCSPAGIEDSRAFRDS